MPFRYKHHECWLIRIKVGAPISLTFTCGAWLRVVVCRLAWRARRPAWCGRVTDTFSTERHVKYGRHTRLVVSARCTWPLGQAFSPTPNARSSHQYGHLLGPIRPAPCWPLPWPVKLYRPSGPSPYYLSHLTLLVKWKPYPTPVIAWLPTLVLRLTFSFTPHHYITLC